MTGSPHPTLDALAELHEGLLAPEESQRVSDHLSACVDCSAARDALADVTRTLDAAAREPITMPAGVAASLDAALARASSERSAGVASMAERRTPNGTRSTADRRRWSRLAPVGAAAATALILGAVGAQILGNNSGRSDSATSSGAADEQSAPLGQGEDKALGETGGKAKSGEGHSDATQPSALQTVTPTTLPAYARQLMQSQRRHSLDTATASCADAARVIAPRASMAAVVRWEGTRAVVLLETKLRRARVVTCGSAPQELYRTPY